MRNLIFAVFSLLLLMGCEQITNSALENNVTNIELFKTEQIDQFDFDMSGTYQKGIELVTLKSVGDFIIPNIDKAELHSDRLFILDTEQSKTLFVYDRFGNPITHFSSVIDFSLNDDYLFVLENKKSTVVVYDISTMDIDKTIKLPLKDISEIAVVGKNILCYREFVTIKKNSRQNSTLFLVDQKGNIVKNWLPITESNRYLTYYTKYPSLRVVKDKVYISRLLLGDFYTFDIHKATLSKSYTVQFYDNGIPSAVKEARSQFEFLDKLKAGKYNYTASGYHERDNFIFFNTIDVDKNVKTVLFDSYTGKSTAFSSFVYSDIDIPIFSLDTVKDDYCISVLPLEVITSMKRQINFDIAPTNMFVEFLKKFDANNGNPVIVIMKS